MQEFKQVFLDLEVELEDEQIYQLFSILDTNGNNLLSFVEFKEIILKCQAEYNLQSGLNKIKAV